MVNISEPLLNVVIPNKPKMLRVSTRNHRLGPKGTRSGVVVANSTTADDAPPANRRDLTPSGTHTERVKLIVLPLGKQAARQADRTVGKGGWKKRRPACNGLDRGSSFAPRESGQTSIWYLVTR
jgi:hypothetical protein